jgi:hypothetical protein
MKRGDFFLFDNEGRFFSFKHCFLTYILNEIFKKYAIFLILIINISKKSFFLVSARVCSLLY